MKIKLDLGAYLPERAQPTDAGMDLRARDAAVIPAGGSALFDTGVHIAFDPGTYGKLESKSGLNVKSSVVSCGGVIDEGYTGSIVAKLYNFSDKDYTVRVGDKVCQLIVQPYLAPDMELVDDLEETERGSAGFGSTGK